MQHHCCFFPPSLWLLIPAGRILKGDVLAYMEGKQTAAAVPLKAKPAAAPSGGSYEDIPNNNIRKVLWFDQTFPYYLLFSARRVTATAGDRAAADRIKDANTAPIRLSRLPRRQAPEDARHHQRYIPYTQRYRKHPLSTLCLACGYHSGQSNSLCLSYFIPILSLTSRVESQQLKLSVNDFVIKAAAMALRAVPEVNAVYRDGAPQLQSSVDISMAVATERGLITPIIRNADQKGLSTISAAARVRTPQSVHYHFVAFQFDETRGV